MAHTFLPFDYAVHDWFVSLRGDTLTSFFKFVTLFGSWGVIVPVTVCVSIFLYRKHFVASVFGLWVTLVSAEATTFVLKLIIARPRPFGGLVPEDDFSFPSGHATIAVAFYGFMVFILIQYTRERWLKNVTVGLAVIFALLIGISRLYLGVHYLSDIVAGYVVGSCGLLAGIYAYVYCNRLDTLLPPSPKLHQNGVY